MKKYIRFEIVTEDRIGITFEILKKIYDLNINLASIEVFPKKVCIKIEDIYCHNKDLIKQRLYEVNGIIMVNEINLLEHEKNERKLLAIIDSIDDGIMYVNKNLNIEIFNSYCENIFHCNKKDVIGKDIRSILKHAPMIELINSGKEYSNIEIKMTSKKGVTHYLTTGIPVKDDSDNSIGVVASIRDIKKAIEFANVVSSIDKGVFSDIIGNSEAIKRVKNIIKSVSKSNSTVILRGESGTGKEIFARAIQKLSNRKDKNFVIINCAALPDNLIESELFGYEKGSFTGANIDGKEGLFKEANGGTLFLDEIGELSMVLQAKLLRVLQDGVVRKIGGSTEEKVDVRIIAATNRNLEEMVRKGQFREDLYYRLNVIPIFIPSLRERMEDIADLVTFFINKLNIKLSKKILGVEYEFIEELTKHNWPGNIRELQNVIERAMNLCNDTLLEKKHLMINTYISPKSLDKKDNENHLKLKDIVEICEKEAIIKALKENKTFRKTAKVLGVSHTTIINKIKKYNIEY
ncbi:PAS domain-containing protein [Clostridium botulinum]|uniref:HTH-type transcriptional regulatory protein TyrR n=1 Tax=Clostridium botulinum D str. 1873 TaxID=592027 RepID=A0A9P2G6T6_CLOBO|nr:MULTISPECIES: sigma 54-interacting transcriptional regulator [Clostridium]EES91037.1 transcriptional regulator [Clostridium botulinum D str. 1873]MBO3441232.1 sigma 54-interacting transcriptional regulator [Clostridium haemolyticum]NFV47408.1 PAS domain-containing protein [Clostridium botulinum]